MNGSILGRGMDLNPYESPTEVGSSPSTPTRHGKIAHPQLVILRLLWAAYLFLALPAVQQGELWFRIASTIMTVGAFMVLPSVAKGWFHLLVAPLYALLCFLQYLVWTFPW